MNKENYRDLTWVGIADHAVAPAFRKLREKGRESQAILGYISRPYLKKPRAEGIARGRVLLYSPGFDPQH